MVENKDYKYIENDDDLLELTNSIKDGDYCALDTEADSLHSYAERICLMQFAHEDDFYVIDTLRLHKAKEFLSRIFRGVVWMHGADYDLRLFRICYNLRPERIYDTQIAARLVGIKRFSLAYLVKHFFDIDLPKGRQKDDWGRRPLSDEMLEYAVNDVRFLRVISKNLMQDLKKQNRFEWFEQSCDRQIYQAFTRNLKKVDPWRLTGSGEFNRQTLAMLRELWQWREIEAEKKNYPPFKIMNNETLLRVAPPLAQGQTPKLPGNINRRFGETFWDAVKKARSMSKENWPPFRLKKKSRKYGSAGEIKRRTETLKHKRDKIAGNLNIARDLLGSSGKLEQLAVSSLQSGDFYNETKEELFMPWQIKLLQL